MKAPEGVAAPLEPSAEQFMDSACHPERIAEYREDGMPVESAWYFAENYAAAVSKNLREERDRLLLVKDCDKCGKEISATGYRICGKCTSELEKEIAALRETK